MAKYYKVGLDNNLQWTVDVKCHSSFEVDCLVQLKFPLGIFILRTKLQLTGLTGKWMLYH